MSKDESPFKKSWVRLNLAVGYFALATACLIAYTNPAIGYEISVYTETPLGFWLGFGFALLVSILAGVWTDSVTDRRLSLLLGGSAVTTFVSLPLIRGYFFYASADSMTHLGWIRDIAAGVMNPVELFYPGFHTLSVMIASSTGIPLRKAATLCVVLFVVVYLASIGPSVRLVTKSEYGMTIGSVTALSLLPINVIVITLSPHPISQACLFFSLILLVVIRYLRSSTARAEGTTTTNGFLVLLLGLLFVLVLYHPQGAFFVFIFFSGISIAQLGARRWFGEGLVASYRPLYVPTLFLGLWLAVWIGGIHQELFGQAEQIFVEIVSAVTGSNSAVGEVVTKRASSARHAGISVIEIFVKLFLMSLVYSVLTAFTLFWNILNRSTDDTPNATAVTKLMTAGLFLVVPWSFLQFVGNASELIFRYLGFLMVIASILGSVGIYYLLNSRSQRKPASDQLLAFGDSIKSQFSRKTKVVTAAFLVVVLAASLVTAFPSTFIYQPSGHINEAQFDGYRSAFEYQSPSSQLYNFGMGVMRYRHAVKGTTGHEKRGNGSVPSPEYDHNLSGFMQNRSNQEKRYLIVSAYDRVSRTKVYRGLRYNQSDFRELRTQPGINRVLSNGDIRIYY